MPGNTFGKIFRVTTWGESHGPAIGAVIDGCPAGLKIDGKFIQNELNRRKPNLNDPLSTKRNEDDKFCVLSGVFEEKTLGTPIAMEVWNTDAHSQDYSPTLFRPGHADKTYLNKYGIRDYRGGGRASGRETIGRILGGAIAKLIFKKVAPKMEMKSTTEIFNKSKKDSFGGFISIEVKNPPTNLGEPVFDKLEADLAKALLSIGAVKSFEIDLGIKEAGILGSENNKLKKGTLGGISTGETIKIKIAVKPTPSVGIKGRHDVCIVPRIVPVAEAMIAITLADHYLRNRCSIL
ncbi:MAG: chorismate synthase, chorismate synthase [Candidatus Peregrinibacteria bacterium GW2011_GWF2_43_17]|nr:MAG: chorismate synthase, chorismate synthase [Candidatus Peregrinibacteria bacterium GW2011_GWF2_43_17]KKT20319.1 MAG: Chorismate synthase [Candidatus Peregrinibacteria bacterium GW2011_GWA2_43_8]HAU39425.1 chorismate synthase [Candidatus Peregrinibacteria bacterium]